MTDWRAVCHDRRMLATLRDLAEALGCASHQAEDVVRSEESARVALSRRGLFKAAGAVAIGSAFSFGAPASDLDLLGFLRNHFPIDAVSLGLIADLTLESQVKRLRAHELSESCIYGCADCIADHTPFGPLG